MNNFRSTAAGRKLIAATGKLPFNRIVMESATPNKPASVTLWFDAECVARMDDIVMAPGDLLTLFGLSGELKFDEDSKP